MTDGRAGHNLQFISFSRDHWTPVWLNRHHILSRISQRSPVLFCSRRPTPRELLANVFLHYVLDLWVHHWRQRHARGRVVIVRYCDDFVMGFQYKEDAEKMSGALRERLAQYGLELNEEKTRLITFGRLPALRWAQEGQRGNRYHKQDGRCQGCPFQEASPAGRHQASGSKPCAASPCSMSSAASACPASLKWPSVRK